MRAISLTIDKSAGPLQEPTGSVDDSESHLNKQAAAVRVAKLLSFSIIKRLSSVRSHLIDPKAENVVGMKAQIKENGLKAVVI